MARTDMTAVEEREWWRHRLAEHIAGLRAMANTATRIGHWTQIEIESLEAIVKERTR